MKYLSKIIVISFLVVSCNYPTKHLKKLNEMDKGIEIHGWSVLQVTDFGNETFYSLMKNDEDTVLQLSFSFFSDSLYGVYYVDNFSKIYTENEYFYQIALQDQDTLYAFRTKSNIMKKPTTLDKMEFSTGKYFFMYKMGKLNLGQRKFFENNKDSLTQVKGNTLPILKENIDFLNDTFEIPEETISY